MRDVEKEIVRRANDTMRSVEADLKKCGFEWSGPVHEIWHQSNEEYTSELRISILRDGQIEDVFEFHLFRNGNAVVTAREVEGWLKSQVVGIIEGKSL